MTERKHRMRVDGVNRMVSAEERDRLLEQRRKKGSPALADGFALAAKLAEAEKQLGDALAELESLKGQYRWMEGKREAETAARLKAAEELGQMKERAERAGQQSQMLNDENLRLERELARARGYIAATKGEPFEVPFGEGPSTANLLSRLYRS